MITAVVYSHCVHMDFTDWDDQIHVFQNPWFKRMTPADLRHFWFHPYEQLYIPVSYMAYALLARIGGLSHLDSQITVTKSLFNPHVFHTANLILHTANVLLVFAVLWRVVDIVRLRRDRQDGPARGAGRGSPWPPFIGALIFAVHPLQVESVAWISEMRGLLCGLFCLLSTVLYLSAATAGEAPLRAFAEGEEISSSGREYGSMFRAGSYWLAFVMFLVALLCKPAAVTLPLALFALDRWIVGRSIRSCAVALGPWLPFVVPFVLVTHSAQYVPRDETTAIWTRPFVAGDALAFYLAKLVAPVHLTIDYGRTPMLVTRRWWGYVTWLIPAALGGLIAVGSRARPWLVAAALWSVTLLLPVLGLAPFIFQGYSTVADRYVYLPMIGPCLAVAVWLSELDGVRKRAAYGCFVAASGVFAALTVAQIPHWNDPLSLFRYASESRPDSYEMRNNYANELEDRDMVDEAIEQYQAAIRMHQGYSRIYNNLGVSLQKKGRLAEALTIFQEVVASDPKYAVGQRNLGHTLVLLGRPQDSLAPLHEAIRLQPRNVKSHSDYAESLRALGRDNDAVEQYRQALALDPNDTDSLYGIGNLLNRDRRFAEAVPCFARTVQLQPTDPNAHAGYAVSLDGVGRTAEAMQQFARALALNPNSGAIHSAYGMALSRQGNVAGGVRELLRAVALSPSAFHYDELGTLYAREGCKDLARPAYEEALTLMPDATIVKQHLAQLDAGGGGQAHP
ncbi:MAG: tetratricopeptide repeat protein [Capsulimonadaceae bacterium]